MNELCCSKQKINKQKFFYLIAIEFVSVIPVLFLIISLLSYKHHEINYRMVICAFLSLLPTFVNQIVVLFVKKKKLRIGLFMLSVVYLPISLIFSFLAFPCSKTTQIEDYRVFDSACIANSDSCVQGVFPESLDTFVNTESAKYYYYYVNESIDSYDIYAECILSGEEFEKEIDRVATWSENYIQTPSHCEPFSIKMGNYVCLVFSDIPKDKVFQQAYYNPGIVIFAYDEQNCNVRYIACSGLWGNEFQPYYLQLDW